VPEGYQTIGRKSTRGTPTGASNDTRSRAQKEKKTPEEGADGS
jgi:hypothetical protein